MAAIGVLYMANTVHTYVHIPLHANHVYQEANSWFHLFSLVKILCTVFVCVYCVRVLGWSDFRKTKIGHLASCANCLFFYPNSKISHFIVALQLEEGPLKNLTVPLKGEEHFLSLRHRDVFFTFIKTKNEEKVK